LSIRVLSALSGTIQRESGSKLAVLCPNNLDGGLHFLIRCLSLGMTVGCTVTGRLRIARGNRLMIRGRIWGSSRDATGKKETCFPLIPSGWRPLVLSSWSCCSVNLMHVMVMLSHHRSGCSDAVDLRTPSKLNLQ
jgi:hypothetical protein